MGGNFKKCFFFQIFFMFFGEAAAPVPHPVATCRPLAEKIDTFIKNCHLNHFFKSIFKVKMKRGCDLEVICLSGEKIRMSSVKIIYNIFNVKKLTLSDTNIQINKISASAE